MGIGWLSAAWSGSVQPKVEDTTSLEKIWVRMIFVLDVHPGTMHCCIIFPLHRGKYTALLPFRFISPCKCSWYLQLLPLGSATSPYGIHSKLRDVRSTDVSGGTKSMVHRHDHSEILTFLSNVTII